MLQGNSDNIILGEVSTDWGESFTDLIRFIGLFPSCSPQHYSSEVFECRWPLQKHREVADTRCFDGVAVDRNGVGPGPSEQGRVGAGR